MTKEANWLPFVTLKAEQNPVQQRKLAELHSRRNIDLLLQAQSQFIKAHDHEVTVKLFLEDTGFLLHFKDCCISASAVTKLGVSRWTTIIYIFI